MGTWKEDRTAWNKLNQCAREACRADMEDDRWFNQSTLLLYCIDCAHRINSYHPGLVVRVNEVK